MLSGLPASGKSTLAKSLMDEVYPDAVRVNKDLLRKMLNFGEYNWRNEKFVMNAEKAVAIIALMEGKDVIVDDTNLLPRHEDTWRELAEFNNAVFIKNTVNTPYMECVVRDHVRADSVGEYVIKNFALELGQVEGKFIICDLDGTLCNIDDRKHFVSGTDKKSWEKFFANIPGDTLREDIAEAVRWFADKGYKIVYLTGRPENYKSQTLAWLEKNGMDFNFSLIMRKKDDKRPDTDVKREMLNKYFKNRDQIYGVIDDRPCVVRMWQEELGFTRVWDVGDGVEF